MTKKIYDTGVAHPAVFSFEILQAAADMLEEQHVEILDPFAGVGKIHQLQEFVDWTVNTVGIEIEPEWANLHERTIVGDALNTNRLFSVESFDAIVTSPVYGNRFSDSHNAKDGSERRSYTHDIGRKLHQNNSGQMQWGKTYRDFHGRAWSIIAQVLRPGGRFILNVSDHIRSGERMHVVNFHTETLINLGLHLVDANRIETRRFRWGANSDLRVNSELVLAFDK